jgi:hypothetical protein
MEAWKWKTYYAAALLEIEIQDGKRQQRFEAAKNAIADRLEDSLHGRLPLSSSERVQIEEACRTLVILRRYPNAA